MMTIGGVGEMICQQGVECHVTGNLVLCHVNSCKLTQTSLKWVLSGVLSQLRSATDEILAA